MGYTTGAHRLEFSLNIGDGGSFMSSALARPRLHGLRECLSCFLTAMYGDGSEIIRARVV